MENRCPICKYTLYKEVSEDRNTSGYNYSCPNCGNYYLSLEAKEEYKDYFKNKPNEAAMLAHSIRKMQKPNYRPRITLKLIEKIIETRSLPTPKEQADNLILWLGESLVGPGEKVTIQPKTHQAIIGAKSGKGVVFVLEHLYKKAKLIEGIREEVQNVNDATLTFEGWARYWELNRAVIASRKAFMAMQYGENELDEVVSQCFKPAVIQTGFDLARLDDEPRAGLIDDRLRVEIRTSRFLIVDLTHENRGAYWEAGFAEGLGKPVIYTCQEDKFKKNKTHFDTNHHLTVLWDKGSLDKTAEELKATIRATLPSEAKMEDD